MIVKETSGGLAPPLRTVSASVIAVLAATGLAVLLGGWIAGSDTLRRLSAEYAAMAPSTAYAFLFVGIVLLRWMTWQRDAERRRKFLRGSAVLIALLSFADLAVLLSGRGGGIDLLFWPGIGDLDFVGMAPATAVCFLAAAACLFRLDRTADENGRLYVLCATAGLLLSSVALTGYVFDSRALYEQFVFGAMALHTAICFVALFSVLLLLKPRTGWIDILLGEGRGSAGARRLLPVVIGGPFLLCLIALYATGAGALNANFRLSLLAIGMVTLFAAVVLRNAVLENRAERKLLEVTGDLRTAVADRDLLLREVYHRVKNNLQQINALLQIEGRKVADPAAQAAFLATAQRIQAMGTVHRLLISSPLPSELGSRTFLATLCESFVVGHSLRQRNIELVSEFDDIPIDVDSGVALGLMVNELVTNAAKHAFAGRDGGRIEVRFRTLEGGGAVLSVADDGTGVANPDSALQGGGTGGLIVRGLAHQLDAELRISGGKGTCVELVIPAEAMHRGTDDAGDR